MLYLPLDAARTGTVVGIDPGTETLGCAVLSFDLGTLAITGLEAYTFRGTKLPSSEWMGMVYNERAQRIAAHHANLVNVLCRTNPLAVASESPFYSHLRPSAYGALTEIVCAIRCAVQAFDAWRTLHLIDPPSVKRAVGAPGGAGKDVVKECMGRVSELMAVCEDEFAHWDEHAIDAAAVAYCQYLRLVHPA